MNRRILATAAVKCFGPTCDATFCLEVGGLCIMTYLLALVSRGLCGGITPTTLYLLNLDHVNEIQLVYISNNFQKAVASLNYTDIRKAVELGNPVK
jgi:hypothetical protein